MSSIAPYIASVNDFSHVSILDDLPAHRCFGDVLLSTGQSTSLFFVELIRGTGWAQHTLCGGADTRPQKRTKGSWNGPIHRSGPTKRCSNHKEKPQSSDHVIRARTTCLSPSQRLVLSSYREDQSRPDSPTFSHTGGCNSLSPVQHVIPAHVHAKLTRLRLFQRPKRHVTPRQHHQTRVAKCQKSQFGLVRAVVYRHPATPLRRG